MFPQAVARGRYVCSDFGGLVPVHAVCRLGSGLLRIRFQQAIDGRSRYLKPAKLNDEGVLRWSFCRRRCDKWSKSNVASRGSPAILGGHRIEEQRCRSLVEFTCVKWKIGHTSENMVMLELLETPAFGYYYCLSFQDFLAAWSLVQLLAGS